MKEKNIWKKLGLDQLIIPLTALALLLLFNLIRDPSFYAIGITYNNSGNPVLSGNIISIIDSASELAIIAIGMTMVTAATGGQDISVGAVGAISATVFVTVLRAFSDITIPTVLLGIVCSIVVTVLFMCFNGTLVAVFKIQPMIATLILFTAGRSIAAWINNNQLPVVVDDVFPVFGNNIPGIPIPTPFFIAIGCIIIAALALKFTNLGLYTQAVGINEKSSRLNGINPTFIKFLSFVILGLCVAVAGLIKVSRISTINYSVVAKDIEMDAILAVALGGNALSGGKFNMTASILGAYVIQFLTTTLYKYKVPAEALPAYKAVVVILLVVLSAPVVKEKLAAIWKKLSKKEAS